MSVKKINCCQEETLPPETLGLITGEELQSKNFEQVSKLNLGKILPQFFQ